MPDDAGDERLRPFRYSIRTTRVMHEGLRGKVAQTEMDMRPVRVRAKLSLRSFKRPSVVAARLLFELLDAMALICVDLAEQR